ncbi:MAG: flippase activity-associated protein Agl23 [Blastocatellia bacterium]
MSENIHAPADSAHDPIPETPAEYPRGAYLASVIAFALALLAGIFLRFYLLEIKPFHHDESVNSYFLLDLVNHGKYKYNPDNYHGPTLYYFALAAVKLFGMNDVALRLTPALSGILTIVLIWPLRRLLGLVGAPVAAWMIALSPGLVYFSRDFIHESSFGLFSLGMVVGAWRYAESKKFFWMVLFAVSAGLLFATKETAIITAVVLVLAAICAGVWDVGRRFWQHTGHLNIGGTIGALWVDTRRIWPVLDHTGAGTIIFIFLNVIFYCSFLIPQPAPGDDSARAIHWQGISDAVASVFQWTERGVVKREHEHSIIYYAGILFKLELPLFIGGLAGGIAALWKGSRFALFVFAWATGISLGYSLIPYKTPWLMISMLIPISMLCGVAAEILLGRMRNWTIPLTVALLALIPGGWMAWQQNFKHHADNENNLGYLLSVGKNLKLTPWVDTQYGYVYAQTYEDTLRLEQAIRAAADKRPEGKNTPIYIASPDYWPLPWYLRDYKGTAFSGSIPAELTQPIVLAEPQQQERIEQMLKPPFNKNTYKLRPGVELILYTQ